MVASDIRKEMPPVKLSRDEFEERYRARFADPVFATRKKELDAIVAAACGVSGKQDALSQSAEFWGYDHLPDRAGQAIDFG